MISVAPADGNCRKNPEIASDAFADTIILSRLVAFWITKSARLKLSEISHIHIATDRP